MPSKQHSHSYANHKRKPTAPQERARPAINPLKKRRRDLTRLLEHSENLPADVRIEHERELASCKSDLDAAVHEAQRSRMIKKYHMVRFFERRKATRALKKARQALAEATPDSRDDLAARVHAAEVDLNYTISYPLEQPYVSLFKAPKDKDEPAVRTHPMWKAVEDAMAQGTLQALRDGKYPTQRSKEPEDTAKDGGAGSHAKKKPERRKRQHEEAVSDNEDGEGFFEA